MKLAIQKVKTDMQEMIKLFEAERSIFQKFVVIHEYVEYINSEPITKEILQNMFDDMRRVMNNLHDPDLSDKEFLRMRSQAIFEHDLWAHYQLLELIDDIMKKLLECKLQDKEEYDKLCSLLTKPYSKKMLSMSFEIVHSNICDELDRLAFCKSNPIKPKGFRLD